MTTPPLTQTPWFHKIASAGGDAGAAPKFLDFAALASPMHDALDATTMRDLVLGAKAASRDAAVRATLEDAFEQACEAIDASSRHAMLEDILEQWREESTNAHYTYLVGVAGLLGAGTSIAETLDDLIDLWRDDGGISAYKKIRACTDPLARLARHGSDPAAAALSKIARDRHTYNEKGRARAHALLKDLEVTAPVDQADVPETQIFEALAHIENPRNLPSFLKHYARKHGLPDLTTKAAGEPVPEQVTQDFIRGLANLETYHLPTVLSRAVEIFDARSVAALISALFDAWETKGFHGRYKWVQYAMGLLGDDRVVVKLEPQIRKWPHDSNTGRKRAIDMMDVFAEIDTPTALMVLLYLSFEQDVPSVWQAANSELTRVAKRRHMGIDALSDRIIPDCGLDERGVRTFDLGGRVLELVLDEDFDPAIRDLATGERTKTFPDKTPGDDADAYAHARQDWALMNAKLAEVTTVQNTRMEEAMISGRTWRYKEWEEVVLHHPLMINYARRLLWGVYEHGDLIQTFRADESGELIDVEYGECRPDADASIRVVHPIVLSRDVLHAWSELFADYEVFPPFEQLQRQLYRPLNIEQGEERTSRFAQTPVPPMRLKHAMTQALWRRPTGYGVPRDHFWRTIDGVQVTVHLDPGLEAGGGSWQPDQTIASVDFGAPIGEVSPVAYSETARILTRIIEGRVEV